MSDYGNGPGRGEGQPGGGQTTAQGEGQWGAMGGQRVRNGAEPGAGAPQGGAYGQGGQWAQGAGPSQGQGQGGFAQPGQGQAPQQAQWGQPQQQAQWGQAQQTPHQGNPAGLAWPGQATPPAYGHPQAPMGYGIYQGYPNPPYPFHGPMGYAQAPAPQGVGLAGHAGMGAGMGAAAQHQGRGPGMSQLMEELAGGGNGLSSLSQMLNLDDKELWKGALIGAAAVLLLTNESVQNALFKTGVRARDAVKAGVDKVKTSAQEAPRPEGGGHD